MKLTALAVLLCASVPGIYGQSQQQQPIEVQADLTDAPRKWLRAQLRMPVHPGPMTLVYPAWIPGEHAPSGPIDNLTGLIFTAGGQTLPWRRDDVDMFALHIDVPKGATSLDVQVSFLATEDPAGFSSGACTTPNLAVLNWNQLVLYPAGTNADAVFFKPSVKLPDGWKFGTALTASGSGGGAHQFETVSLEMLVDSPVMAGRYFREVPLAPEVTPKHFLDLVADGPEDLEISDGKIAAFSKLVREAGALFHSRHYDSYHFLLTLSDGVAHFGLEHHQSSDDRADARMLVDEDFAQVNADLLPHEFTHSWNGKYRRPAGLATRNYQLPMKGDLLWVYEGLTQYMGDVMAARSGLWTADQYREYLAASAAEQDHRPGRTWRDLEDTAVSAQILYATPEAWDNWRRSTDFYAEGELIWLEVDTVIRRLSKGTKSLNDFCAAFYGVGGNTGPKVLPYTFDDVVMALNGIQAYDWAQFFRERLHSKAPHAPLNGITGAGYKLEYTEDANDFLRASASRKGDVNAWYSIGLRMSVDGTVSDVLVGSPAFAAGLGPGMKILAVNGRRSSDDVLRRAMRAAKTGNGAIQLMVENQDTFKVVDVEYSGGERYPHLVAAAGASPDVLRDILKPLTGTGVSSITK